MDRLVAEGAVGEMIFAMVDASNRLGGSWYRSSPTIGDYERYITEEVVGLVDSRYRTVPHRGGRGVSGYSMGGYGAIHLALKYPQTFGAVVVHAGHYDSEVTWKPRLEAAAGANPVDWAGVSSLDFFAKSGLAIAAGISANPANAPLFVDLPFALVGGQLQEVPDLWRRYTEADILHGHLDGYLEQPERLRGIMLIHGAADGLAPVGQARALDAAMAARAIDHVYWEHSGGHVVMATEPQRWLGFLSDNLTAEPALFPAIRFDTPPVVTLLAGEMRFVDLGLELDRPLAELGFAGMQADLSTLGGAARVPVGSSTGRGQVIELSMGPLANGLYRVPVRVVGDDGRDYLLFDLQVAVYPTTDLVILDEDLGPGWSLEGARNVEEVVTASGEVVFAGRSAARLHVKKSFAGWSVPLAAGEALSTFGYSALHFAFAPGEVDVAANDRFTVGLIPGKAVALRDRVDFSRREWQVVEIPLEAFAVEEAITAVNFAGNFGGVFYVDDVRLVAVPAPVTPTAVAEDQGDRRPHEFALLQNYPNPFNSETAIDYGLPAMGEVELAVFDLAGQRVATLVHGSRAAGAHRVRWDGRDEAGHRLASGVYLYRLTSGGELRQRRMLLLK